MIPTHPPVDDPPFDALVEEFLLYQDSRNLSPNTLRVYDQAFRQFRRFAAEAGLTVTASTMTTDLFRRFHAWLKVTPTERTRHGSRERSPGGIANRMRCMRALVKFCQEEELIVHKVTVKEPAVPKPLFPVFTDAELSKIFSSRWCRGRAEQAIRNRALLTVMLDSGLRVGEIGTVTVEDLLLEDRLIRVMGKGRKARFVPFSRHTAEELEAWLDVRDRHPGLLFELTVSSIQSLCRTIGQELGISMHPHKFRHSFATRALKAGMDIHTLKRCLGHSLLSTTEVYLSLSTGDIQEAHERVSPMEGFVQAMNQRTARRRSLQRRSLRLADEKRRTAR